MSEQHGAVLASRLTLEAFDAFDLIFRTITRRAQQRFTEKNWRGFQQDGAERLDAYDEALDALTGRLESALGSLARDQALWKGAKPHFAASLASRFDIDRAETFFNSVTRRMLRTVGINRDVEFFTLRKKPDAPHAEDAAYRTYWQSNDTPSVIRELYADVPLQVPYEDRERDILLVSREIDLHLWPVLRGRTPFRIDAARALFFRNKEAYIIARILAGAALVPCVIPLTNRDSGIRTETVLLHSGDVSVLFSFAYSYFFVDVERYDALIEFLHTILPDAEEGELYTALGYNRHGKTEFYRELHGCLHTRKEQFEDAPGEEGAVMIAFTLPNFRFVFKVIKDRPCFLRSKKATAKVISNEKVRFQYAFVSHRDKAGRMVDTQEFENLRFKKKRFSDLLLHEFELAASREVTVQEGYVIIHHLYVQRKVVPLPLYFQAEKDPQILRSVLIDFGYFLKDLAASGVFPCDLFNTWNYGVTQWGRVVLYDYDDIAPLDRVRFREKPALRHETEETEAEEDRIFATEEDFFMDEMERFVGIPGPLKGVFKSVHADLFTVDFWNALTERVRNGEIFDVVPYDRAKRFLTTD